MEALTVAYRMENVPPVVSLVGGVRAETRSVISPDGRRVAFAEFGDRRSTSALLYFHGAGSSRFEPSHGDEAARRSGWRIVAVDRAGHGLSDPLPGRRLEDIACDAVGVLGLLGVREAVAVGYSAGAPHALAAVRGWPALMIGGIAVNTAGDPHHPAWRSQPVMKAWLVRVMTCGPLLRLMQWATARWLTRESSEPGRDFLAAIFSEGLRQGRDVMVEDARLCYEQPWAGGFEKLVRPFLVLQGRNDLNHDFALALPRFAPTVEAESIPGGHMDGGTPEVWRRLLDAASAMRMQARGAAGP